MIPTTGNPALTVRINNESVIPAGSRPEQPRVASYRHSSPSPNLVSYRIWESVQGRVSESYSQRVWGISLRKERPSVPARQETQ